MYQAIRNGTLVPGLLGRLCWATHLGTPLDDRACRLLRLSSSMRCVCRLSVVR